MSVHIIRADLSNLPFKVDFIVNTANPLPRTGNGLDKAIYRKAGPEMLEERKKIGSMSPGEVAVTKAYGLEADFVIHAVSVAWQDGLHDELSILKKCYYRSLSIAADYMEKKCLNTVSIAMPLIGTGIYQIPFEHAITAAISTSISYALQHSMEIYIVVFDERSVSEIQKAFPVERHLISYETSRSVLSEEYTRDAIQTTPEKIHEDICSSRFSQIRMKPKTFAELLNFYMEKQNISSSTIVQKMNISRQALSYIRNGDKIPKKETAVLLAVCLELNLPEMEEFLTKSGHALSDANTVDRNIKEELQKKNYDVLWYKELFDTNRLAAT